MCYDSNSNKYKFSRKDLNKRTLEDCGDGPMAKYRKLLDEFIIVTSTNRGFRTVHHSVATYEQSKKGLSYFYPKRIVDADGIHTPPLNLYTNLLCTVIFLLKFKCKAIVSIYNTCHSFKLLFNQLFQTITKSFYIALSHISIRRRINYPQAF